MGICCWASKRRRIWFDENVHAELQSHISADDVEPLRAPKVLKSEAHHVHNVDKKEWQAENHRRQDLDFCRIGEVQPSRNRSRCPYQERKTSAIHGDAGLGRRCCCKRGAISRVWVDTSGHNEEERDDQGNV